MPHKVWSTSENGCRLRFVDTSKIYFLASTQRFHGALIAPFGMHRQGVWVSQADVFCLLRVKTQGTATRAIPQCIGALADWL